MNYQTFAPPNELSPFVKFFWTLSSNANCPDTTLRAFPDGCPGIIMIQSESALCSSNNQQLSGLYLHGQAVRSSTLSYSGNFTAIGISFHPHGLKSLFGIDAYELTGTGIDLASLSGKKKYDLIPQLTDEQTIEGKINLLSYYLSHQHRYNGRQADQTIQYAVTRIMQAKGNLPLKILQEDLQMSERSLERKFNQSIGISPKLFSRICRFQESLIQLKTGSYDKLSDVAYENEYVDQSYFIKVFKEFTGFSPLEFTKQQALANHTENLKEIV